jgi:hypothetical protein
MDKITDLMQEIKDSQNNVDPKTLKDILKESMEVFIEEGLSLEEIQEKLLKECEKQAKEMKYTIWLKSCVYDYEIKTQYEKDNWRMILMERILNASMIAIYETVNKYKPEEKWSYRTQTEDAWKNEDEILMEFLDYDYQDPSKESQFTLLTHKIRENLVKLKNNELDIKNYGEGFPLDSGAGTQFSGKKGMRVEGAYSSKYSSFDWRCTFMGSLISDIIEHTVINISKHKDTMKFSDKINLENSKDYSEEIIEEYTKKELKNLFKIIRKSIIKRYSYE